MIVDIEACKAQIPPSKFDSCMFPFSSILLHYIIPLLYIAMGIFFCGIFIYTAQTDLKGFLLFAVMMALLVCPIEESHRYRVETTIDTKSNRKEIFTDITSGDFSGDDVPLLTEDDDSIEELI